ncbi:MAG: hypothetical protein IPK64_12300 [bacterium]|nr:hypothetical protein [bacterium]
MSDPRLPEGARRDAFERQVDAVAGRLRDDGVPPARDLWPDLSAALDAAGPPARRGAGRGAGSSGGSARRPGWSTAALAAGIVLAIGIGLAGRDGGPATPSTGPHAATPGAGADGSAGREPGAPADAAREGLRAVALAYDELQSALERAPDDPDLTRLVLVIHHARGRLLRLQAEDGVRDARRTPA